ncbi:Facilitated trehalose transporter Tret1 [Anthophora retusa]
MKILMRADTHVDIELPGNTPVAKCTFTQVLAALSVSMGSMVVGYSSSYTSPGLVSMRDNATATFEVTKEVGMWIGSIMPLSALFGGIAGGPCIEYLGRRNTILSTALPFIAAWLLIALATNVTMVLVGRALCGFCVGIASLSLPVYLGETIQAEVRGTLGLLPTAFGNTGILLCFIAGMYLDWRNLALVGACLPIPFMILMFTIPETPRWYISKGKKKRARKSLQWLRGKGADITEEMSTVERLHTESERNVSQAIWYQRGHILHCPNFQGRWKYHRRKSIDHLRRNRQLHLDVCRGSCHRQIGQEIAPLHKRHIHVYNSVHVRHVLLHKGRGCRRNGVWLDTPSESDRLRDRILSWIRSDPLADDGRDLARQDSRFCS